MTASPPQRDDPYSVFAIRDFRRFVIARNLSGLGETMLSVAVGWELYERTGEAMTLAWVGLVQVLPVVLFSLHAGHVADQHPRRRVAVLAQAAHCLCSAALAASSLFQAAIPLYYVCLFGTATARAFGNPARGALLPQIVPLERVGRAVSWDTSIRRVAQMSGATLGGWIFAWTGQAAWVCLVTAACGAAAAVLLGRIADPAEPRRPAEPVTWKTLIAGIEYIRRTHILLGAMTLDLVAVFLGGATTLLPIFAADILDAGPDGLGWLRAAPSAGALVVAIALAHLPSFRRPGRTLLWVVAGFGVATVVFGLSRSLPLSLAALFALGALDMVSVVVRQTLLQTLTPDDMRGRVNAVNGVFTHTSNELGGFESGAVAQLTTPVFSVVSGGAGTILVALTAAVVWPSIRAYRRP